MRPPTIAGFVPLADLDMSQTILAGLAQSADSIESILATILNGAPADVLPQTMPSTRMAIRSLEWHARELEKHLTPDIELRLRATIMAAIDSLVTSAAVLKCLQEEST